MKLRLKHGTKVFYLQVDAVIQTGLSGKLKSIGFRNSQVEYLRSYSAALAVSKT